MNNQISVRIVADSISPQGVRIITFELEYPRIIHCFDEKTEILSQINSELPEFRSFKEVFALNAKVAQYDDATGAISFVTPSAHIENEGHHRMVSLNKKKFPMLVTDKHRVLTKKRTTGGKFVSKTILAEELVEDYGTLRIEQSGVTDVKCDLSDAEIEFCVWFAADGHTPEKGDKVNFHFKKSRKAQEVTRILEECGYEYSTSTYGDDIVIRFNKNPLTEACYTEEGEKKLPEYIRGLNIEQYLLFKRALLLSDGNIDNMEYNTTSKTLINQIQVLAHLNGDSVNIRKYGSLYKCSFKVTNYISLRQDKDIFEYQDYVGKVYCVSVDTSYVVVRREGVVFISGNCELMTHRLFSRNAMSSRAIPISKMIEQVRKNPAMPVQFGKNKPGMQDDGNHNAEIDAGYSPEDWWRLAALSASRFAEAYSQAGYHKQVANRLLEPFQRMKTVVTATDWNNFFHLRADGDADPTIHKLASLMKQAVDESVPELLEPGQWHTPYVEHLYTIDADEGVGEFHGYCVLDENNEPVMLRVDEAIAISVSCCAQVSYRVLNNTKDKALDIYKKLTSGDKVHASPFEHVATPMLENEASLWWDGQASDGVTHMDRKGNMWSGNLRGWVQYRQLVPNNVVAG